MDENQRVERRKSVCRGFLEHMKYATSKNLELQNIPRREIEKVPEQNSIITYEMGENERVQFANLLTEDAFV